MDDYQKTKGLRRGGRKATRRLPPNVKKVQEGGDVPPGGSITSTANYKAGANIAKSLNLKGGAAVATNIDQIKITPPVPITTPKTIPTMPGTTPQVPLAVETPATKAAAAAGTLPPVSPATPLTPTTTNAKVGGGKVALLPSRKKKASRVVLAPPGAGKRAHPSTPGSQSKTRKIRVQLSGLKKRLTKAKSIGKDSREKPIADIRKLLEDAKLIKPATENKKVPESVLRDIYKDYLLLRNRAL